MAINAKMGSVGMATNSGGGEPATTMVRIFLILLYLGINPHHVFMMFVPDYLEVKNTINFSTYCVI